MAEQDKNKDSDDERGSDRAAGGERDRQNFASLQERDNLRRLNQSRSSNPDNDSAPYIPGAKYAERTSRRSYRLFNKGMRGLVQRSLKKQKNLNKDNSGPQTESGISQAEDGMQDVPRKPRSKIARATGGLARAAQTGASLAGSGRLSSALGAGAALTRLPGASREEKKEALKEAASYPAGYGAKKATEKGFAKAAEKAGKIDKLAGGKASAIGGAVGAAIRGEGIKGIALTALNYYVWWIAFGALWTLVGFIPALLYLDFHFAMSLMMPSVFQKLPLYRKIILAVANMIGLFLFTVAVTITIGMAGAMCNMGGMFSTIAKIGFAVGNYTGTFPVNYCQAFQSIVDFSESVSGSSPSGSVSGETIFSDTAKDVCIPDTRPRGNENKCLEKNDIH